MNWPVSLESWPDGMARVVWFSTDWQCRTRFVECLGPLDAEEAGAWVVRGALPLHPTGVDMGIMISRPRLPVILHASLRAGVRALTLHAARQAARPLGPERTGEWLGIDRGRGWAGCGRGMDLDG